MESGLDVRKFWKIPQYQELDCVCIIQELLCVKFVFVSLALFDISDIDCMSDFLCAE